MINFESWAKYQWQGKHLDVTRVDHQVVDWYSKESEKKVVCFIEFIDKPQFTYVQTTECYSLTIVENVVKDIVWVPKEIWINLKQVVWVCSVNKKYIRPSQKSTKPSVFLTH